MKIFSLNVLQNRISWLKMKTDSLSASKYIENMLPLFRIVRLTGRSRFIPVSRKDCFEKLIIVETKYPQPSKITNAQVLKYEETRHTR